MSTAVLMLFHTGTHAVFSFLESITVRLGVQNPMWHFVLIVYVYMAAV